MDENLALVLHGCNLAKNLESNLPMLSNQPDNLLVSCQEIIRVFGSSRERLLMLSQSGQTSVAGQPEKIPSLDDHHVGATILESMRTATATAAAAIGGEPMAGLTFTSSNTGYVDKKWPAGGLQLTVGGWSRRIKPTTNNAPDSGRTRSYYRCTHQKLYDCPAKKQVQRLEDEDPFAFDVTYRETHTCHVSSTAASPSPEQRTALPPTSSPPMTLLPSSSLPTAHWMSTQLLRNLGGDPSIGSASPSAGRFSDHNYQLSVADMADVMFNSGSSSSNSMDLIFMSVDEKWDSEDKKD